MHTTELRQFWFEWLPLSLLPFLLFHNWWNLFLCHRDNVRMRTRNRFAIVWSGGKGRADGRTRLGFDRRWSFFFRFCFEGADGRRIGFRRHFALCAVKFFENSISKHLHLEHLDCDSLTRQVEPRRARVALELNGNGCGRLLELKPLLLWKFPEVSLAKVSTFKVISVANDGEYATFVTGPIANEWRLIVVFSNHIHSATVIHMPHGMYVHYEEQIWNRIEGKESPEWNQVIQQMLFKYIKKAQSVKSAIV